MSGSSGGGAIDFDAVPSYAGLLKEDGLGAAVLGMPFACPEGVPFAGAILDRYRHGGLSSLRTLGGSFAVVVVDRLRSETHLITDLLGSHSLYYARTPDGWAWSTRLADVVARVGRCVLDEQALVEALCFRFFSGTQTLFTQIRQVPPGSVVSLRADGQITTSATNRPADFVAPAPVPVENGVNRLDDVLTATLREVRARHSAVTVFLSGGLDSSLLLAKTLETGFDTVRCCTTVFPGWDNPELPLARRVAAHLKTPLEEIAVNADDVRALFPRVVLAMEEPPRHYKIFALWKLYEYAAREAPLVISGIGAENVMGPKAVTWLRANSRRLNRFEWIPLGLRRRLASLLPRTRDGRLALLRNLGHCAGEQDLFAFLLLCDERLPHTAFARAIPPVPGLDDDFWPTYVDGLPTLEDRQQVYGMLTEDKSDMQSRVRIGGALGVDTVHPFLSHEALRLGLSQPVSLRSKDGWSKPLFGNSPVATSRASGSTATSTGSRRLSDRGWKARCAPGWTRSKTAGTPSLACGGRVSSASAGTSATTKCSGAR